MGVPVSENFFQNFKLKIIVSDDDFKNNFKTIIT